MRGKFKVYKDRRGYWAKDLLGAMKDIQTFVLRNFCSIVKRPLLRGGSRPKLEGGATWRGGAKNTVKS